jgi:hypothetical protein
MKRTGIVAVMAAGLIGTMSSASFAASDFEGVWKVKDTAGKQFELTLSGGQGNPRGGNDRQLEGRGQRRCDHLEHRVDH